jgi:hypothetical protein
VERQGREQEVHADTVTRGRDRRVAEIRNPCVRHGRTPW